MCSRVSCLAPAARQEQMRELINGIHDEDNENTKLSESSQQWVSTRYSRVLWADQVRLVLCQCSQSWPSRTKYRNLKSNEISKHKPGWRRSEVSLLYSWILSWHFEPEFGRIVRKTNLPLSPWKTSSRSWSTSGARLMPRRSRSTPRTRRSPARVSVPLGSGHRGKQQAQNFQSERVWLYSGWDYGSSQEDRPHACWDSRPRRSKGCDAKRSKEKCDSYIFLH